MNKRRIILRSISAAAAVSASGIPLSAFAKSDAPKLDENDPQAVSLGYKHDTTKVDQKKFPKHDRSQICADCQFYQGAATEPWAPCTVFGGKQVAAKGWCSAYVKKTGQSGGSSGGAGESGGSGGSSGAGTSKDSGSSGGSSGSGGKSGGY